MMEEMKEKGHKNNSDGVFNPMLKVEDGLVICKFGWFQVKLLLTTLISVFATTSVTTTTSYILPSAECDLNMDMMQKGMLNAIPFLGQVCACFVTGFMTDAFGRKIVLVGGNFGIFVCAVFGGSSQTYGMLVFGKLMEGILMSLVFTATATMVTELCHRDVRDRVLLLYCSFMSTSIMAVALLAWILLPLRLEFVLVKGYFELHSWNIYLYASASWSLIAALMYWRLPESPKFLLSHGQENEALEVLKSIYHVNTGKDKNTFPIQSLNVAGTYTPTVKTGLKKQVTDAMFDVKELFRRPLFCQLVLFSMITFICLLGYSAVRLWYPQLSTIIENYQKEHNGTTDEFCIMLDSHKQIPLEVGASSLIDNSTQLRICKPIISGSQTYTNGIIMGFVALIFIGISGYLVDFFGQKPLMFIFLLLCSISSLALYWTNSSIQVAILVSSICASMQAAYSLQQNILVRVFPTTVRTIALSLVIMNGRIGSLLGNILFPVMLEQGCMTPFITLSVATLGTAGLVYFLPNPKTENNGTGDK